MEDDTETPPTLADVLRPLLDRLRAHAADRVAAARIIGEIHRAADGHRDPQAACNDR